MRRILSAGAAASICLVLFAGSAPAWTGRLIRQNCSPIAAGGGVMAFNVRQANGLFDVRVGDAQCDGTAPLPARDGHRGASDLSANGRYLLLTTAYGPLRRDAVAEPGKGYGNDLELLDRRTGTVRRLTAGRKGIIWAKLKPDLTKVVWAEMTTGFTGDLWNQYLGSWSLHVADLSPATGTLSGERVWTPPTDAFVETYGWIPGTNRIVFASDSGIIPTVSWLGHWYASQLQTIPDDLSTAPVRLSPPVAVTEWDWSCWCNRPKDHNAYHEFVHTNGDGWLYTAIAHRAKDGGMDLWRYRPDGSGRERVSYFGGDDGAPVAGWPAPRYAVVGSMAWIDGAWVAAVARDAQAQGIDAYRIAP